MNSIYNQNINFTKKSSILSRFSEYEKYNQLLYKNTQFNQVNTHTSGNITQVVVSFRFRSIDFNKKRSLPFFFVIELLTNRKCVASLSQRNVLSWKLRKGMLVGCKVTLSRDHFYSFFELLYLTFSRMEKFQPVVWSKKYISNFYKYWKIKKQLPFFSLTLSELVLFYPIESCFGAHPDVQRVKIVFNFSTYSLEEQYFLLRFMKIPLIFN